MEENAELECEKAVLQSLTINPDNLEGLQTLASFRISQCRWEEAGVVLQKAVIAAKDNLSQYCSITLKDEFSTTASSGIPFLFLLFVVIVSQNLLLLNAVRGFAGCCLSVVQAIRSFMRFITLF
jgi:hypothetical protein